MKSLIEKDSKVRDGQGRRSVTTSRDGKYIRSMIPQGKTTDLAIDATLRAAAPYQKNREGCLAIKIEAQDLRQKVRERKIGNTIIFIVDASGSMGAEARMTAVKGAILTLLMDAYQKRDKVGLVVFRGDRAEVLLPPTQSVELARKYMEELPVGGKTPLVHGLTLGFEIIKKEMLKDKDTLPIAVLISDGKANVSMRGGKPVEEAVEAASLYRESNVKSIVIDSEKNFLSFGLTKRISEAMGAKYIKLEELDADRIVKGVNEM
ncbi:vWA domain-containing protein [Methanocella conradii]|uniref:vWA domain-containing protein n=1 Tax=Methanocella conradii TaxID=1175444 RepID=UPI001C2DA7CF|nr:VWA domain-containing protein [Methanocella conradii]